MLSKSRNILLIIGCCAVTLFTAKAKADVINLPTVTVMADHSLSMVVTEIARNYSSYSQTMVNTSFLPQTIQQEQISEGAAADILITSKEAWIEDLKLQGLIDIHSQTKLASDRLVLIGNRETNVVSQGVGRFPWFDIISAGNGEANFIIGNPEALMEGIYSKEALRNMGVAEDLEQYTLYIKQLGQMFDMVAKDKYFALCFYSSTLDHNDIKIIDTIPESAHKPINYYTVVIAGDNMDEARKFLEYLKSDRVRKIFRKYGFTTD